MITFQGNKQILKSAKMLESKARNTYPHISTSKLRVRIGYENEKDPEFFSEIKRNYSLMRKMIKESGDYYTSIVYTLSEGKMGNCAEDAMFTELLGKINGQKNIYTGSISIDRDGKSKFLDHVVAFITDKPVIKKQKCLFKNKDAIIIDPWLGITDFAGSYFTKLKSIYRKIFMHSKNKIFGSFTNDELAMELLRTESKNPKEFRANKKKYCPTTTLGIFPYVHDFLNTENLEILRQRFPKLVIKNFKQISLKNRKAKIIKLNPIE